MLKRFLDDETGATVIEYGLIAAIIGAALIFGFGAMHRAIENRFIGLGNTITNG
ncbi:MAG: Flp family type IVb pilin [Rhizobiaceae bacterium]|nr:Flp family type IVb pilin [Rhizobiaceae bacterium]